MRKNKKYDDYELKEKIIKEKILEGKSYPHLSKKYDIPEGTITTWVYQYRKNNGKIVKQKRGVKKQDETIDYKERYEILKKYLEFLEEVDQGKK